MWSKLLMFMLAAFFLAAVGTGIMAHDGRISNIISEPNDVDEHPWGGENRLTDGPQLTTSPIFDPDINQVQFLFIRIAVKHYWLSVKNTFGVFPDAGEINRAITEVQTVQPSSDGNTNNTDQGTRD